MPAGFYRPSSEIEPIVGIQFGIFSPEEIERRSVVEITTKDTYEGNEPKIGGLFDPRMGVLDNGKNCRSCGQTNHGCPGHFGHYRLARPVYFYQFHPIILNILGCVCIRCSKLLIDKESHRSVLKKAGEARWRDVLSLCSNIKRCGQDTEDGCGSRQPMKYTRDGIARIIAEWESLDDPSKAGGKTLQPLEVEYVLHLFRRITDEDVDFMGFSRFWCRPDWMICTVLPIPPPQVRPSVVQENNQRSEDDLTHKLFDIIKQNKILQQKIESNASKNVIDEMTNVVQYHIATLVDNQIPGVAPSAQRSGRALKSIQQRLGSKEGRIRYNIQGKRVEFSARSVITPDPNISIAEIGVPIKIAMNLTKPEVVTQYNRDQLYRLVQNGADKWPGAKTIVRRDGRMISLKHVKTNEIVLHFGDTVNRHLLDGDTILFNRQPTLHRMSMMGHRVKVLPYNTFRLNVMVTSPYNADFDGDEMNAHIPQSYEASTELEEIAAVPHQIITPRDGKPVIGVVQDTLVGSFRITREGVKFNRREFMNLMMWNKRFGSKDYPNPETPGDITKFSVLPPGSVNDSHWSGHQVVSSLLPPINITMKNKRDVKVEIREGILKEGQLDKDIFAKASKGIVHVTYNDYGSEQTVNMLDAFQNTIEQFLIYDGFSVGISDLVADEKTHEEMNKKIQARKKEIEELLLQVHLDLFDNNTGKSNQDEFEGKVFSTLNKATTEAGTVGQSSLADENRLLAMVRCGSKGNEINVAQMIACVGQQNIDGKRIPYGFTDRTLPHYKKYDDGAEARGFIESSFIRGLTPQEFFFHAMSGREGLIDTAVKTADTGYIQRQLVKAMEDLVTQNDGTVRDSKMNILQFHYGEDGINSTKIENQSLDYKLGAADIRALYGMSGVDFTQIVSVAVEDATSALHTFIEGEGADKRYRGGILGDRILLTETVFKKGASIALFSPVNIERMILNAENQGTFKGKQTDLTPLHVLEGITKVIERTQPYNQIWKALLRFHLAPHKMIVDQRFPRAVFDAICERIIMRNWKSQAQPGEQVGIIAAQSIGEPSTQMTLNSTDWDTRVIITCDGEIQTPQIGEFIDNYYTNLKERADKGDETAAARIQMLPNNQIYIELNDGHDWKAVSCDENGIIKWTTLEAITRHPVINEDNTNTILEVETESGRIVKATKAVSFLTRSDTNKVIGIKGSDLKVGMPLPIAQNLAHRFISEIKEISLRKILPPTEWLYGTDASIALATMHAADNVGKRHWFGTNNGLLFTVPYARSDSFRDAFAKGHNTNAASIKPGFVYTKKMMKGVSQIPDTIQLTHAFGYLVGAYLAEGMSNDTQINITNNEIKYLEPIKTLMNSWEVGYHMVMEERHCEKTNIKGTSTSLVIHSTLLAHVMKTLFGRVSYEKTMPAWVLQAPETFIKGLVDAYICGDGTISKEYGYLSVGSCSRDLLVRFSGLLTRFGIFSKISGTMPEIGKFDSVRMQYTLTLTLGETAKFTQAFTLSMERKQEILDYYFNLMQKNSTLRNDIAEDIIWDPIKSIKEITPIKEWVYDLTVADTRNFMTYSCLCLRDTFHLAGVAAKSNVTRGVPRLKELLKVTQNPKATSLTIYLKPEYRSSKERAREVAQDLELTLLRDIVTKTAIYFDPKDDETVIEEDKDLINFFKAFELVGVEKEASESSDKSKWLLRMEFDREKMFNKNISMDDINFALQKQTLVTSIQTIYSDYNSPRQIMRLRMYKDDEAVNSADGLDDLAAMKKLQNKLLTSIIIRGVPSIKAVTYRKIKDFKESDGEDYKPIEEYVLDTDGSNILEAINHPMVDASRIYTTDVYDVLSLLGVEAARSILLSEITGLFEEVGLNFRHLGLLCDVMTRGGRLMSIDRYGINKNDIGPLAKASFEETEKILLKAALFSEVDPITGVSANIMTGQPIRGGTAFSQIMLDEAALMRVQKGLPPSELDEEDTEWTEEEKDAMLHKGESSDLCNDTALRVNMLVPNVENVENEEELDMVLL